MRAPRTEDEAARFAGIKLVYADSVAPIEATGQLRAWDGEYRISAGPRPQLASGHTLGSSVLWLQQGPAAGSLAASFIRRCKYVDPTTRAASTWMPNRRACQGVTFLTRLPRLA